MFDLNAPPKELGGCPGEANKESAERFRSRAVSLMLCDLV
jgi:hypothetical protein